MTLTAAIADSLRLNNPRQASEAVHTVVINALRTVAPQVAVTATDYFTHSFVPDLQLSWDAGGALEHRNVHLRFDVTDDAFAEGATLVSNTEPIFLGLSPGAPVDLREAEVSSEGLAGTLVTVANALDAMYERRSFGLSAIRASQEVVRGGRGPVDAERADELVGRFQQAAVVIEGAERQTRAAAEVTEQALDTLAISLKSEPLARLERDLRTRWIRAGEDPTLFPGRSDWRPQTLDDEELGEALNALLDSDQEVSPLAWGHLASHLGAQHLADVLGKDRSGGRLNGLAAALHGGWTAEWASVETFSEEIVRAFYWFIQKNTLGVQLGDLRVSFRDDGRRFRDKKPTTALPSVAESQRLLGDPAVQAASFRTEQDEITHALREEAGASLFERVAANNPHGLAALRLESLVAQVSGRDYTAEIELDRKIIDVKGHPTPVTTLIRLAHDYIANEPRAPWGAIAAFLRTGEPEPREMLEEDQAL